MKASVVVSTRFAIQGWGRPPPEPDWIRHRWDLWRRIALPAYLEAKAPLDVLLFACEESAGLLAGLLAGEPLASFARVVETTTEYGLAPSGSFDIPHSVAYLGVRCDSDDVVSPRVLDALAVSCLGDRHDFYDLASGFVVDLNGNVPARLVRHAEQRQGPFFAHRETDSSTLFCMDKSHATAPGSRNVPTAPPRRRHPPSALAQQSPNPVVYGSQGPVS